MILNYRIDEITEDTYQNAIKFAGYKNVRGYSNTFYWWHEDPDTSWIWNPLHDSKHSFDLMVDGNIEVVFFEGNQADIEFIDASFSIAKYRAYGATREEFRASVRKGILWVAGEAGRKMST